jgi:hypothetical protein
MLLGRRSTLRRSGRLRRRTPLRRSAVSPASAAQRTKVAGRACIVCGGRPADPAHLIPRSLGGCDQPDCVVPLDRRCHRAYDRGQLDLLPHLEPRYRAELAHGLLHLGLLGLLGRISGTRWVGNVGGQPRQDATGSDGEEG